MGPHSPTFTLSQSQAAPSRERYVPDLRIDHFVLGEHTSQESINRRWCIAVLSYVPVFTSQAYRRAFLYSNRY
jgi:hypothetical protein